MRKLAFVGPQRKVITIEIDGRKVTYFDELWKKGIQIYPLDNKLILKMKRGSKKIQFMAAFILDANKGKDFEEYKSCKTEEDVAQFVIMDCKKQGLIYKE